MGLFSYLFCGFILFIICYIAYNYLNSKRLHTQFQHFPYVYSQFLDILELVNAFNLLPASWAPFRRPLFWENKYSYYKKWKTDIFAVTTRLEPHIFVADADIVKEIVITNRTSYRRKWFPGELFGPTLLTSEGDQYRKHIKVVGPSFSERTYRLVHEATIRMMKLMFDHWDTISENKDGQQETTIQIQSDLLQATLSILSHTAFGQPSQKWNPSKIKKLFQNNNTKPLNSSSYQYQFTFQETLEIVAQNFIAYMSVPKILFYLPIKNLQTIKRAKEEYILYINKMIEEKYQIIRKEEEEKKKGGGGEKEEEEKNNKNIQPPQQKVEKISARSTDLFTNMVLAAKAPENTKSGVNFNDKEIQANLFLFVVAGHETTTGTLTWTLTLLALHPEVQTKLDKEIKDVIGSRLPEYDDYPQLTYTQYVLKEVLRLYPVAPSASKTAIHPTTIHVPKSYFPKNHPSITSATENVENNDKVPILIPKGTNVILDFNGLGRNPKYWNRPDEFLPERFDPSSGIQEGVTLEETQEGKERSQVYHRFAWTPFSEGHRSCIGQNFAETEMVFILVSIIQRYSVHLSPKMDKTSVLKTNLVITLLPEKPVELVFRRK